MFRYEKPVFKAKRLKKQNKEHRIQNTGDLFIDYFLFTTDYLILSLRPLRPLWLNNERRIKEIFLEFSRHFAGKFV